MGVIGDQVFIPGTPVMTLPELLQEAEAQVGHEIEQSPRPGSVSQVWNARARLEAVGQRDPFKTPMVDRKSKSVVVGESSRDGHIFAHHDDGERAWTKEEWKQLDACFTDERLYVGSTLEGAGEDTLAPVDMISIDDVVDRLIAFIGGQDVVQSYGDAWSRLVLFSFLLVAVLIVYVSGIIFWRGRVLCSENNAPGKLPLQLHLDPLPLSHFHYRLSLPLKHLLLLWAAAIEFQRWKFPTSHPLVDVLVHRPGGHAPCFLPLSFTKRPSLIYLWKRKVNARRRRSLQHYLPLDIHIF